MLKQKAISGVKWTSTASIATVILQILQLIILSRFLSPADFGLVAITMAIIGFALFFVDMGLSSVIIHKQDMTLHQLSTLFWINIFLGILSFVLFLYLSSFIASFYQQPELKSIVLITSISFLILPIEQQFLSIMKKRMLFNTIARRDILSKIISFVSAVALAWKGFGAYALAYSYLIYAIASVSLIVIPGLKLHKPQFYFNLRDVQGVLKMGFFQLGNNALNYFNKQIDTLIIGKLLGKEAVGIYSMAKNLAARPSEAINPIFMEIGFPLMSQVQQDVQKLKQAYLKCINYVMSISFPVYIGISVCTPVIVSLFLEQKWNGVIPVLQILSIYYMVRSSGNPIGALLGAVGMFNRAFYWNLALFFLFPGLIILFSSRGVVGIAMALAVFSILLNLVSWWCLVYPACKASFKEFIQQYKFPLVVALIIGGMLYWIMQITLFSMVAKLFVSLFVAVIALFFLLKRWNKPFFDDLRSLVISTFKKTINQAS